ncbi:MAG: YcaO-like family protein [Candidatus Levybacteria bacterium]|nr:YcaO-like family protein [Candidatus Levybacteria bacterium]
MDDIIKMEKMLSVIKKYKLLNGINEVQGFHDEPQQYQFVARLNIQRPYTSGYGNKSCNAGGVSFESKENALIKCLGESIERFCFYAYRKKKLTFLPIDELEQTSFPINSFRPIKEKKSKVGCIKGFDLYSREKCDIPAALIYGGYKPGKNETSFEFPLVTTGAAGGFSHEETVLRGIYEVVERDAIMGVYLNSIPVPMVNLLALRDKRVTRILALCTQYKLKIYTFEITNNIGIPAFLSVLIDKSGLGPAVSLGAKAGFNIADSILGSMNETFMVRTLIRRVYLEKQIGKKEQIDNNEAIIINRGLFWWDTKMISKLSFLLKNNLEKKVVVQKKLDNRRELKKSISLLKQKGLHVYVADITADIFHEIKYTVYKVFIPGLQPLYLNENEKQYVNIPRLKEIAEWFGVGHKINSVPHPFL